MANPRPALPLPPSLSASFLLLHPLVAPCDLGNTRSRPEHGRNRPASWQKWGFCEVFRRAPRRRVPWENGVPQQRRQRFSPLPSGRRESEGHKQIATLTLPRRSPRRTGGAGRGGGTAPAANLRWPKNVQSKQSPKAALLQGWFHFRERISRLCKKRERRRKKKSMWLPSSVHKYCRNLQMAALLPNSDHTASPNSMEMNYCRCYSAAHHVGLASAPSPC